MDMVWLFGRTSVLIKIFVQPIKFANCRPSSESPHQASSSHHDYFNPYPYRRNPQGVSERYLVFFFLSAQIRDELRATFRSGVTRPLEWRKHQLYQLARLAQNEANAICDALARDYAKPRGDALGEVFFVIKRALGSAEQLDELAKHEQPDVPESQKSLKPT